RGAKLLQVVWLLPCIAPTDGTPLGHLDQAILDTVLSLSPATIRACGLIVPGRCRGRRIAWRWWALLRQDTAERGPGVPPLLAHVTANVGDRLNSGPALRW